MKREKNKILLSGGGTMGSVTPLLAVAREYKKEFPDAEFLWIGTKNGPEKKLVEEAGIRFKYISAGKLRRYFSLQNVLDIFLVVAGFFESLEIINNFRPSAILSAGGFVSVPVVWAGRFLSVPSLIHQQDVRPGLANKLMAPAAKKITVTFEDSLKHFNSKKTSWVGNPVRPEILTGGKKRAIDFFKLNKDLPAILILGGGTGSLAINSLIKKSLPSILKTAQVIHLTGKGKDIGYQDKNYHSFEFITKELPDVFAAADLVISRAGLSTITELSALEKPSIIIPLPGHQEDNAKVLENSKAAIILDQKKVTAEELVRRIEGLLNDEDKRVELSKNISQVIKKDAAASIVKEILEII